MNNTAIVQTENLSKWYGEVMGCERCNAHDLPRNNRSTGSKRRGKNQLNKTDDGTTQTQPRCSQSAEPTGMEQS